MYKIAGLAVAILAASFYVWSLKGDIESLESKNSNLKSKLEVCKSAVDAKKFEAKWSEEFSRAYELNISDIEETGVEVENSTQNDSGTVYYDTF